MTELQFSNLSLPEAVISNLSQLGYTQMTPIQAKSLPLTLNGKDLIAQAKTGSGKTAAFGIPLLQNINPNNLATQAMVIAPTRELADQVATELRKLARALGNIKVLTLGGGVAMNPQVDSLAHGAHIVVGTAGRLQKHLDLGSLNLEQVNTLVLDEADRMLDMGFYDSIEAIIKQVPSKRQTLLFSATYPDNIQKLASQFMNNPERIEVVEANAEQKIEQRFYEIDASQRMNMIEKALLHFRPNSSIAFCFTKQQAQEVADYLVSKGFGAAALHGDLDQKERDLTLLRFANNSLNVLVATDVAARGIDIAGLDMVLNVELSAEPETHIHRVGRTGRAGETGVAVSLVAPRESRRAQAIEALYETPFTWYESQELTSDNTNPIKPAMRTLSLLAGKKDKLRPADIVGALTVDLGIPFDKIGKINIYDHHSYVALHQGVARQVEKALTNGKMKGRAIKVRLI